MGKDDRSWSRSLVGPTQRRSTALARPAAIVVLTGLAPALAGILTNDPVGGGSAIGTITGPLANSVAAVGGGVTIWLVYSASFYVMATRLFDGQGAIRPLLNRVGWGFAGLLVASVALASNSLWISAASGTGGVGGLQSIAALLVVNLAAIGLLYSIVHWTNGVATTLRVGYRAAFVSVVGPVLVSMGAFSLSSLM